MKFRTEEVPFMGDIEATFCQVKVPDSQRSFSRYLWWNNNDLNGELVDYKIGVHVFEGSSSPGCCNYALRRTAVDNATKYDTAVAETLLHNFYVDDRQIRRNSYSSNQRRWENVEKAGLI